jgi:hypothetical protein
LKFLDLFLEVDLKFLDLSNLKKQVIPH